MRRFWIAAAVILGLGSVGYSQVRMQQIIDAQTRDRVHDAAVTCVNAWEGRSDSRDMSEKVYRRNAETLVALSTKADPEKIAAYEAQVERDVKEIRSTLPNPACNLDAAKKRLEDE